MCFFYLAKSSSLMLLCLSCPEALHICSIESAAPSSYPEPFFFFPPLEAVISALSSCSNSNWSSTRSGQKTKDGPTSYPIPTGCPLCPAGPSSIVSASSFCSFGWEMLKKGNFHVPPNARQFADDLSLTLIELSLTITNHTWGKWMG